MKHFVKLVSAICLTVLLATSGMLAGEIHDAAAAGDLNKVKALLEADSTLLESKDNMNYTPLMRACSPPWKVEVANLLLDKGADVNVHGVMGFTPLHFAGFVPEQHSLPAVEKHVVLV